MLKFGKITHLNSAIFKSSGVKHMSICCPPPKKPSGCGPGPGKVIGQRIPPPAKGGCKCKPRFAPNPCVPRFHDGKDTWKKYRFLSIFVCFPLIIAQAMNALSHAPPHKGTCRDYEYMRIRNKKYPWGTGNETFFHNEHVNHLPGECEPPEPDCD